MPTQAPLWMRLEADCGGLLTPKEEGDLFVLEYARLFREWDGYSGLLEAKQANATANRTTVLDSAWSHGLIGLSEEERVTPIAIDKIGVVAGEVGNAAVSSILYDRAAEDLKAGRGEELRGKFKTLLTDILHRNVTVTAVHDPSSINRVYGSSGRVAKQVPSARGYLDFRTKLQPETPATRAECDIPGAGELWISRYFSSQEYLVWPLIDNDFNATVDLTIK